jgi:hypothetical protein
MFCEYPLLLLFSLGGARLFLLCFYLSSFPLNPRGGIGLKKSALRKRVGPGSGWAQNGVHSGLSTFYSRFLFFLWSFLPDLGLGKYRGVWVWGLSQRLLAGYHVYPAIHPFYLERISLAASLQVQPKAAWNATSFDYQFLPL